MKPKLVSLASILLAIPSLLLADDAVYLTVLGIAQDAGHPQTGCYQPHCMRAWEDPSLRRTASSIAVIDEISSVKLLFDATPDMREQLYALQQLAPDDEFELAGVFLTHAHIGHYVGLMHFGHEAMGAHGVAVYAMPRLLKFLSSNGPWDQLVRFENIRLRPLAHGAAVEVGTLRVTPFIVPHRDEYSETVGYRIEGPRKTALFIPDIDKWADWDTDIRELVQSVDYALVDATFFADGELPGRDMSRIRHPFVSESMALFESLDEEQKQKVIFIHMNHSNPLLVDGSDAQKTVTARGFRFAREGMRLEL